MRTERGERGSVIVTVAIIIAVLIAFLALVVDVGMGYIERRVVQAVADAAALAGVQVLADGGSNAEILAAIDAYIYVENPLQAYESGRTRTAQWLVDNTTPAGAIPNNTGFDRPNGVTGVLVTVTGEVPTYFARIWNITEVHAVAAGGGGYSPLDVILVLDRSGSMNDDSCFLRTTTSGFSLRSYAKTDTQCGGVMTGDGLASSNCDDCGGRWHTTHCDWPGGSKMGSEVSSICGSVHTSRSTCEACKGIWKTPEQPVDELRIAARGFVDQVQAQLSPTFPHVGLVSYSTSATLDTQLTGNLNTVKTAISSVAASGYTNCEDGMYRARMELTTSGRQRWNAVKVIIFMSDGNANRCRDLSCTASTAKTRAINEAKAAGNAGIIVYSIGLGEAADEDMLQQMVMNNGVYLYAPSGEDLDGVYRQMFEKIKRLRLVV